MAQYLISVPADTADFATAEEMAAIDVFNERLRAEGRRVFAGSLAPPSTAHHHRRPQGHQPDPARGQAQRADISAGT
jgi:hypothetical protein